MNPLDIKDFIPFHTNFSVTRDSESPICLFHSGTQLLGAPWVKLYTPCRMFPCFPGATLPTLPQIFKMTYQKHLSGRWAARRLIWKSVFRLGFEPRTRQLKGHPLYQLSYRNYCLNETFYYRRDSNPRKFISNEMLS